MCLGIHDHERRRAVQESLPPVHPGPSLSRPRLVGAIAAALVAIVVVAALMFPSSTTAVATAGTPPAATAVIEQTATTVDDGVPSSTEVARRDAGTAGGHCQHDL